MLKSDFIRIWETESRSLEKDINLNRKLERLKQLQIIKFAYGQIGVEEIPGPESNETIIKYHKYTSLKASDDDVSWCSAFVNYCTQENGLHGTNDATARSWLDWGVPLMEPEMGCIVVYWRSSPDDWRGHVGLFVERRGDIILTLGGNQNNKVCIKPYSKNRLLGYRGVNFNA